MNVSKEWILSELSSGRWIAHRLATEYQKSLSKALTGTPHFKNSLNYLTLAYYRRASHLSELNDLGSFEFFDPKLAPSALLGIFGKITQEIFGSGGEIITFSQSEQDKLQAARTRAAKIWQGEDEIFALPTLFVRVKQPGLGTSFPQSFGTIYYGERVSEIEVEPLAISLSHELAHHELFLINLYDRLINPAFDKSLRFAPLQKKERPPIGRLHSLFALFRMIQTKVKTGAEFANDLRMFHATEETFGNDELTPFAREMVCALGKGIG